MASQLLQPHCPSFPSLFEMAPSLHINIYLYLHLVLFLFYSFIYLYINTPTLPFNYYSFIIHLMPGRIFSPFSLVFKNFLSSPKMLLLEYTVMKGSAFKSAKQPRGHRYYYLQTLRPVRAEGCRAGIQRLWRESVKTGP